MENLPKICASAEVILNNIDQRMLAVHYGFKLVAENQALVKERKDMDKQRLVLIDALFRKARAHGDAGEMEKFNGTYSQLQRWINGTENKYIHVGLQNDLQHHYFGSALKVCFSHSHRICLLKDHNECIRDVQTAP